MLPKLPAINHSEDARLTEATKGLFYFKLIQDKSGAEKKKKTSKIIVIKNRTIYNKSSFQTNALSWEHKSALEHLYTLFEVNEIFPVL